MKKPYGFKKTGQGKKNNKGKKNNLKIQTGIEKYIQQKKIINY